MANWFETKVTYDNNTGRVTEVFLIDALSFTEAEARTIAERSPYISGDFSVKAAKRTNIAEIVYGTENDEADKWYQVKWVFETLDEKPVAKGKAPAQKTTTVLTMVLAEDLQDAIDRFNEFMKNTLADYEIVGVTETPVLEVYPAKLVNEND